MTKFNSIFRCAKFYSALKNMSTTVLLLYSNNSRFCAIHLYILLSQKLFMCLIFAIL